MKTATNPDTGERLYLSDDGWKPLVTATNPDTGEKVYLRDGAWAPLEVPANEAGKPSDAVERAPARRTTPAAAMTGQPAAPVESGGPRQPVSDLAKRAARGATDVAARAPEGYAIATVRGAAASAEGMAEGQEVREQQIRDITARLQEPDLSDDERAMRMQQLADLGIGQEEIEQRIAAAEERGAVPAEDTAAFQYGDRIRQASQELFGTPDPEFDDRFMSKLAEGAGNMAGFVGVTLLTGLPGGAAAGSAFNSSAMYERAKQEGASEQEARAAAYIGSLVGASEVFPIGNALRMLPSPIRGKVAKAVGKRVSNAFATAGEEGAQEALVEIANNLTAQGVWDSEVGWAEGAGESAILGAILGGGLGAASPTGERAIAGPVRGGPPRPDDVAPIEPIPPLTAPGANVQTPQADVTVRGIPDRPETPQAPGTPPEETQISDGQAPPVGDPGGRPGGGVNVTPLARPRTEAQEMAERIAANIAKARKQREAAEQPAQPAQQPQDVPAAPAAPVEPQAAPDSVQAPEQGTDPAAGDVVSEGAPRADDPTVGTEAAPAEVRPASQAEPAAAPQFDAERTEGGYFPRVSPPEGGQRTFRDQVYETREEAKVAAERLWAEREARGAATDATPTTAEDSTPPAAEPDQPASEPAEADFDAALAEAQPDEKKRASLRRRIIGSMPLMRRKYGPAGTDQGYESTVAYEGDKTPRAFANSWDELTPPQREEVMTRVQLETMPNEPTARKPSKKAATKPRQKLPPAQDIEAARKDAVSKLKAAYQELLPRVEAAERAVKGKKDKAGKPKQPIYDGEPVTVELQTATGKTTRMTFRPTREQLENIEETWKRWQKLPKDRLAFETTAAEYDPLDAFAPPMPNHQPLWRSIGAPPRPADNQINVAGQTVKLPPMHKPVRREGIRLLLEQIIGQRVYTGKVKGKSVAGYYSRKSGAIRMKRFDDIEVMAHEMAHWLDFNSTMGGVFNSWRRGLPKALRKEMGDLSYTSEPSKVQSEGFAEFLRLWLTQYDTATQIAPNVTQRFEALLKDHAKMDRRLRKLQREMHAYYYQGALAQARGNIGKDEGVVTATRRFVSRRPSDRFRQQAIDGIHGIKIAERETLGELQEGAESAYKLMQLANGAGSLYDAVIHQGTLQLEPDGSIGIRGKGLQAIFEPIYKKGALAFDDFLVYATGRRAQELKEQGRENLFTKSQIKEMLALERDGFADVFEEFQTFNAEMLDFYVDMGLITPDQRTAFQQANQNYVPFHRITERLETGKGGGSGIGARLTGGDRNVRDIAENIVSGLHTNIRAAMVARAKQRLYQTLTRNDTGGTFAVPLAPDSKKVRVARDDMAKKIASAMADIGLGISNGGMIVANPDADTITDVDDIAQVLADRPDLAELWQHNLPPTTKDTLVDSVIINGERRYFEVNDPVLIESMTAHQIRDQWLIVRAMIAARRFISASITIMPPFMLPNAVRDTVSASTMSDSGFRPVYDTLRGMKEVVFQSSTYKEWKRNGGGYSSLVQSRANSGSAGANLALPARTPMQYLGKALSGVEAAASLFENGSRVGEYMRAIEKGASKSEAAYRSREISTDFSRQPGSYGWSTFLQTVPFANAAIQGNDLLMRKFLGENAGFFNTATGAALARRLTNKWGLSIAAFTGVLWAINEDDERYQKLTPDEKGRFWHVWLPDQDQALRIPKPYGQGLIFADLVENTLDYVKTREGSDTARNLAWALPHHFWFMDYPGVMSPFIEDMRNENFTGAPIVPHWLQQASPQYQFRESTPEIYRLAGESLNLSPLRTQHYARGFFGYMETAFTHTTDLMLWDEERYGPRPFPNGLADYAFKQFRSSPYPYRTKYTEGYYDLRQRARTAATDLRIAESQAARRPKILRNLSKSEQAMFFANMDRQFSQIDRHLARMRDAVDAVRYDPSLSQEQKETQIEALYRDRDRLLTDTYEDLNAAVRALEGRQ